MPNDLILSYFVVNYSRGPLKATWRSYLNQLKISKFKWIRPQNIFKLTVLALNSLLFLCKEGAVMSTYINIYVLESYWWQLLVHDRVICHQHDLSLIRTSLNIFHDPTFEHIQGILKTSNKDVLILYHANNQLYPVLFLLRIISRRSRRLYNHYCYAY